MNPPGSANRLAVSKAAGLAAAELPDRQITDHNEASPN
jgi:hypothetical protein